MENTAAGDRHPAAGKEKRGENGDRHQAAGGWVINSEYTCWVLPFS